MKNILFAFFILPSLNVIGQGTLLQPGNASAVNVSPERLKRIDQFIQGQINNGLLNGAIAFVARDGKIIYNSYCTHCHGAEGKGDGLVVQNNGPKPPAYNSDQLKDLPVGKMYHTIMYGKNMMGSHASQITATQRWKVVQYVQTLQKTAGATAPADTAATAQATPNVKQ